jgi:hypothetical protein
MHKDTLSLSISCLSILMALISGVLAIANIDKDNAIQHAQITSIFDRMDRSDRDYNQRFDRIENKIDKLRKEI